MRQEITHSINILVLWSEIKYATILVISTVVEMVSRDMIRKIVLGKYKI